jgi:hypothetical protein
MAIIWVSIPTGKEQMSLITQTPWLRQNLKVNCFVSAEGQEIAI